MDEIGGNESTLSERTTSPQRDANIDTPKDLSDTYAASTTKNLAPEPVSRPGWAETHTYATTRSQNRKQVVSNSSQSDVNSAKEDDFPANKSQCGEKSRNNARTLSDSPISVAITSSESVKLQNLRRARRNICHRGASAVYNKTLNESDDEQSQPVAVPLSTSPSSNADATRSQHPTSSRVKFADPLVTTQERMAGWLRDRQDS